MTKNDFENLKTFEGLYAYLIDSEYFTKKELELILYINGFNVKTLNNCIYARFGYRDIFQMLEEFEEFED